jgi:hypothetical protein
MEEDFNGGLSKLSKGFIIREIVQLRNYSSLNWGYKNLGTPGVILARKIRYGTP